MGITGKVFDKLTCLRRASAEWPSRLGEQPTDGPTSRCGASRMYRALRLEVRRPERGRRRRHSHRVASQSQACRIEITDSAGERTRGMIGASQVWQIASAWDGWIAAGLGWV